MMLVRLACVLMIQTADLERYFSTLTDVKGIESVSLTAAVCTYVVLQTPFMLLLERCGHDDVTSQHT